MNRENRNTVLFISFFLLAGFCYLLSRDHTPLFDTLMFCANYIIYAGLLNFWIKSVRDRLLPSKTRTYVVTAAFLMQFYLFIRAFKYRIVGQTGLPGQYLPISSVLSRYAVYAYYVPMIVIPTLFLMAGIRVCFGESKAGKPDERCLLLPALLLSLLFLTNDLHYLVYIPKIEPSLFRVDSGTYLYGPVFWIGYAWMVLAELSGILVLFKAARNVSIRAAMLLTLTVLVWAGLIAYALLYANRYNTARMYSPPEICIFGFLAVFEICIRNRMVPSNENHIGFFQQLGLPVLITDREMNPVYETDLPVTASREQLSAALSGHLYPEEDIRLSGMAIRAGYVFWMENESELHKENRRLAEANALLEEENDLIAVENSLKEKKAQLDARNRVYGRIAAALYPRQKRIEELLRDTEPGTEAFRAALGECCVLNAYSKRKGNLLLSEETLRTKNRELFLALKESARFLNCCGVEAAAMGEEYSDLPPEAVHALYDAFETVIEAWLPSLRRMTISLSGAGIRLVMELEGDPELPPLMLPAEKKKSEEYTFLTIRWEKGGSFA